MLQGSEIKRQENRDKFLTILETLVPEVPEKLLNYLEDSDFFRAPASTKYHDSYEGGLLQHSLNVYERLAQLNYQYLLGFPDNTVAKVALFHDVCKIGFYKREMRNKKLDDGRWIRTEVWGIDDQLPIGHGEKSVIILLRYGLPLTEEEILAIRWHMLGFDDCARTYAGGLALSNAMSKTNLVTALHMADLMSTWMQQGRDL